MHSLYNSTTNKFYRLHHHQQQHIWYVSFQSEWWNELIVCNFELFQFFWKILHFPQFSPSNIPFLDPDKISLDYSSIILNIFPYISFYIDVNRFISSQNILKHSKSWMEAEFSPDCIND
jgi:hypothetical protein